MLTYIVSGRFWFFKALVVALISSCLFSAPPILFSKSKISLPTPYEAKRNDIFFDTANLTPSLGVDKSYQELEKSHFAKVTPRIMGAAVIWCADWLRLHPLLPSFLGGIIVLAGVLYYGSVTLRDRRSAFWLAILVGGLFVSIDCFTRHVWHKPYDGIALGFLALSVVTLSKSWLSSVCLLAALWTDERVLIAMPALLFAKLQLPTYRDKAQSVFQSFAKELAWLLALILTFLISRYSVSEFFQWQTLDTSLLWFSAFEFTWPHLTIYMWTLFEGGWIIVLSALALLWHKDTKVYFFSVFVAFMALVIGGLTALDMSRTSAFSFPLLIGLAAFLKEHCDDKDQFYKQLRMAALISLIATPIEIVARWNVYVWSPLREYVNWSFH